MTGSVLRFIIDLNGLPVIQFMIRHCILEKTVSCCPFDQNQNAHLQCIILYATRLEIFHCMSEAKAKVAYFSDGVVFYS